VNVEFLSQLEDFRRLIEQYFPIEATWSDGGRPAFTVRVGADSKERFLQLRQRLEPMGYLPLLRERNGVTVLGLLPRPPRGRWRWQMNLALFIATLGTTFLAGYANASSLVERGLMTSAVNGGLAFSLSLILILGTHEMGHKIVSIIRGIESSLPYFIPMFPPVGTMGAVIQTQTPAPNRDALIELGASGPIAGFLVAVPVLIVGLKLSFVPPASMPTGSLISFPDPLLIQLLAPLLRPGDPDLIMHPVYFAGWIGLVITSVNLLPASMLDGGHVVRALFGAFAHRLLSYAGVVITMILGFWPMAILILLLLRRGHPGPLDDVSPMSRSRAILGIVLFLIFALSAVRLPLRMF